MGLIKMANESKFVAILDAPEIGTIIIKDVETLEIAYLLMKQVDKKITGEIEKANGQLLKVVEKHAKEEFKEKNGNGKETELGTVLKNGKEEKEDINDFDRFTLKVGAFLSRAKEYRATEEEIYNGMDKRGLQAEDKTEDRLRDELWFLSKIGMVGIKTEDGKGIYFLTSKGKVQFGVIENGRN